MLLPLLLLVQGLMPPPDPGGLISTVAELVLRARLREAGSIKVDVSASPASLLSGGVDGVKVRGKRWCTPLRLSCTALSMDVGRTTIDPSALLTSRRIALRQPARGSATIQFTESDWDNFLIHPLMASALQQRRNQIKAPIVGFRSARSHICPETGAVEFDCQWGGSRLRAQLTQVSSDGCVAVSISPAKGSAGADALADEDLAAASMWLAGLFTSLVIDLDGCALSFRALDVLAPSRPQATAELRLNLDVCVRSFPSLAINF